MSDKKPRAVMQSGGRLALPVEALKKLGWEAGTTLEIVDTPDGVMFLPVETQEAHEVMRDRLNAMLPPLGTGRGKSHNKYVSRWRHPNGQVVVSENGQPNVWIAKSTWDRFTEPLPCGTVEHFVPGEYTPGFHSNVSSTPGLSGQPVVKLRTTDATEAADVADFLFEQLEAMK